MQLQKITVSKNNLEIKGFRGGNFTGFTNNENYKIINSSDKPHIAATYCALSILKFLSISKQKISELLSNIHGNNIELNEKFLLNEIKLSQSIGGNISCQSWDTEDDVRFFYCACAIHKLLYEEDLDYSINYESGIRYLNSLNNFEGGFSMIEGGESNGNLILFSWFNLLYCSFF